MLGSTSTILRTFCANTPNTATNTTSNFAENVLPATLRRR